MSRNFPVYPQAIPSGPYNVFAHFISQNPKTSFNPNAVHPVVERGAFIGPFASVIGDVTIKKNTFVAPIVSIRADEGTPFYIGEGTNLQDGVILHGLKEGRVQVEGGDYSIYIDCEVTVAHGAIVHGPAYVGRGCFIGFQSLVFQAILESNVYVSNNAVVTGKVRVRDGRFVPPGAVIDTQEKADRLGQVPKDEEEFAKEVQRINREFSWSYPLLFGKHRCTCGLACDLS